MGLAASGYAQAPRVARVDFLLGRWLQRRDDGAIQRVEEWSWGNDSVLIGRVYRFATRYGRLDTVERATWLVTAGFGPPALHRTAEVPRDSLLQTYFLTAHGPGRAVFVNRWVDFPQSVTYERSLEGSLRVMLSGRGPLGAIHREYLMRPVR